MSEYLKRCRYKYSSKLRSFGDPSALSSYAVGKLYEYLWAIKLNMLVWEDMPPGWKGLPSRDMGVDLVDEERSAAVQCKCFRKPATIKWAKFSTFHSLATHVMKLDEKDMTLCITPQTRLHEFISPDIKVIRRPVDELLAEVLRIDVPKPVMPESDTFDPRPYQLDALDVFKKTGHRDVTRFQLPCRTGKTYIMACIIKRFKQARPSVVFVNRISLARQHVDEFCKHGLVVGLVGDGEQYCDPNGKDLIVCVDASVDKLPPEQRWGYKILDEAHHYENTWSKRTTAIGSLPCQRTLMFSATYKDPHDVDYKYSIEDACKDGWIADYRFHVAYFDYGTREDGVVTLVNKYYRGWSPMLVCFNTVENATDFTRRLDKTVTADIYTATTTDRARRRIMSRLESNTLDVVAVVGCLNEGITIKSLRTVVFGELRNSPINKTQVAMRATTPHYDKECARIVLPVFEEDFKDPAHLRGLLRSFGDYDRRIETILRLRGESAKIQVTIETQEHEDQMDADEYDAYGEKVEALYEQVYDRLGRLLKCSDVTRAEQFVAYVDRHASLPIKGGTDVFTDDMNMASWFSTVTSKQNRTRLSNVKATLYRNDLIKQRIDQLIQKQGRPKKTKCSDATRAEQFVAYVDRHASLPIKGGTDVFTDDMNMARWFHTVTSKQSRTRLSNVKATLYRNDLIKQRIDQLIQKQGRPKKTKCSDATRAEQFVAYVDRHASLPIHGGTDVFTDDMNMASWFSTVTSKQNRTRLSNVKATLYRNDLIKQRIDQLIQKQGRPKKTKCSDATRAEQFVAYVDRHGSLPIHGGTDVFTDDMNMASWFHTVTSKQSRTRLSNVKATLYRNDLIKQRIDQLIQKQGRPKKTKCSDATKAEQFVAYVDRHASLPIQGGTDVFTDDMNMASWFSTVTSKRNRTRLSNVKATLYRNDLIKQRIDQLIQKQGRPKKTKCSDATRAEQFVAYVDRHASLPIKGGTDVFTDDMNMASWFSTVTLKQSRTRLSNVKATLYRNDLIKQRIDQLIQKQSRPKKTKCSDATKAEQFVAYVDRHASLPIQGGTDVFTDDMNMASWFSTVTSKRNRTRLSNVKATLYRNDLIKQRIDQLIQKQGRPKKTKCSDVSNPV